MGEERTAATYSRASYTSTTIGNAVFDGRVRDGIGSGHRFMATEKLLKIWRDSGPWGAGVSRSFGTGNRNHGSSKTAHKKGNEETLSDRCF